MLLFMPEKSKVLMGFAYVDVCVASMKQVLMAYFRLMTFHFDWVFFFTNNLKEEHLKLESIEYSNL